MPPGSAGEWLQICLAATRASSPDYHLTIKELFAVAHSVVYDPHMQVHRRFVDRVHGAAFGKPAEDRLGIVRSCWQRPTSCMRSFWSQPAELLRNVTEGPVADSDTTQGNLYS